MLIYVCFYLNLIELVFVFVLFRLDGNGFSVILGVFHKNPGIIFFLNFFWKFEFFAFLKIVV